MAGGKKKKKPVSNPARGFATTSIASKPRAEIAEITPTSDVQTKNSEPFKPTSEAPLSDRPAETAAPDTANLTPEEFEKQLEEAELQNIVEKHAQKSKRDATRQIVRLQTDRRLLRSQAEPINTRRWLPPELMDEILEAVAVDSRSAVASESATAQKPLSEEDLIIRLWTLQQTLAGAGFGEGRVGDAIEYILTTADKVLFGNKESVWGLEESLDWLARESPREDLPDYDHVQKKYLQNSKHNIGGNYIDV